MCLMELTEEMQNMKSIKILIDFFVNEMFAELYNSFKIWFQVFSGLHFACSINISLQILFRMYE